MLLQKGGGCVYLQEEEKAGKFYIPPFQLLKKCWTISNYKQTGSWISLCSGLFTLLLCETAEVWGLSHLDTNRCMKIIQKTKRRSRAAGWPPPLLLLRFLCKSNRHFASLFPWLRTSRWQEGADMQSRLFFTVAQVSATHEQPTKRAVTVSWLCALRPVDDKKQKSGPRLNSSSQTVTDSLSQRFIKGNKKKSFKSVYDYKCLSTLCGWSLGYVHACERLCVHAHDWCIWIRGEGEKSVSEFIQR